MSPIYTAKNLTERERAILEAEMGKPIEEGKEPSEYMADRIASEQAVFEAYVMGQKIEEEMTRDKSLSHKQVHDKVIAENPGLIGEWFRHVLEEEEAPG